MTAPTDVIDLSQIVCRFAERFHRADGNSQVVASPLGAWILLALSSRTATSSLREELTGILGVDVDAASALATQMLEAPHAAVASAVAAWVGAGSNADALAPFMDSLPEAVEQGVGIPPQPELDHWARQRTDGLIEKFPVEARPDTSLLMASALATRVRWLTPFTRTPATHLGPTSKWSRTLHNVLRAPDDTHGHVQFIARTASIGDVAVHTAWSQDSLSVTSVIAMPDVHAPDVLAAAHDIATHVVAYKQKALSLYAMPLGDSPIWSISETEVRSGMDGSRTESLSAVLPAWEARTLQSLLGRGLGFEQVALVLSRLAGLQLQDIEVRQSAMARFTRLGFEAAAVTALEIETMGLLRKHGTNRHAELRFGHPFAVVAVTNHDTWNRTSRSFVRGPWHQVPVFSAWITDPMDAMDDEEVPNADRVELGNDDDPGYDRKHVGDRTWPARIRDAMLKLRRPK